MSSIFIPKPDYATLANIDMSVIQSLVHPEMHYVIDPPGRDHYRLLVWIARNFPGKIYEVGTHRGASSTAMSDGGKRTIITYDITAWEKYTVPSNIYRVKNPMDDIQEIATADMIFYDTAHDGIVEREFAAGLDAQNFKGVVVYDDIHLNPEMESFWNDIPQRKEDWTDIGHWSGTGVVYYT